MTALDRTLVGIRVLVIDDHAVVAQSLVMMLRAEGLAADRLPVTASILDEVHSFAPAVILLDLNLGPAGPALPLVPELAATDAAVIIFSGATDRALLAEAVEAGAVGILNKLQPAEEVLHAVRKAAATGSALPPDERHELLRELRMERARRRELTRPFEFLTNREREVLGALMAGHSAADIAAAQYVSVFTVRGHIRAILAKLGASSQLAAVVRARQAGWSPPQANSQV